MSLEEHKAAPILTDDMKVTGFRIPVPEGVWLTPDAADRIVGRTIDVDIEGVRVPVRPSVKAARVVNDGRAIELDLEWPGVEG